MELRKENVVWMRLWLISRLNAKISSLHFLWTQVANVVDETPRAAWWASSMAAIRFTNGLWRLFCLTAPYLFLCLSLPFSTARIESVPSIKPQWSFSCTVVCFARTSGWRDGRIITGSVHEAKVNGSSGRIAVVVQDSFAWTDSN